MQGSNPLSTILSLPSAPLFQTSAFFHLLLLGVSYDVNTFESDEKRDGAGQKKGQRRCMQEDTGTSTVDSGEFSLDVCVTAKRPIWKLMVGFFLDDVGSVKCGFTNHLTTLGGSEKVV